jgi:GGDEF domain-containing protein
MQDATAERRFARWPADPELTAMSSVSILLRDGEPGLGVLHAISRTSGHFDRANVELIKSISTCSRQPSASASFRHRALHDALTGLANRTPFVDRRDQAMQRSRRHGTKVAVLFLDVDGFKRINDRIAHRACTSSPRSIAPRLRPNSSDGRSKQR